MSIEIYVYLKKQQLPTATQWSEALKKAGFDIVIDPETDLLKHSGFLPVRHGEIKTGFEFDIAGINKGNVPELEGIDEDNVPDASELIEAVQKLDTMASFRFTREDEGRAAEPAALVLASMCRGVYFDPQNGMIHTTADDLADAIDYRRPDFWLNAPVNAAPKKPAPGTPKRSFEEKQRLIEKLLDAFQQKHMSALPPEYETLTIDGIRIVELTVLPPSTVYEITKGTPTFEQPIMLCRSIQAIDRVFPQLTEPGRVYFSALRQLCVEVLDILSIEMKQ